MHLSFSIGSPFGESASSVMTVMIMPGSWHSTTDDGFYETTELEGKFEQLLNYNYCLRRGSKFVIYHYKDESNYHYPLIALQLTLSLLEENTGNPRTSWTFLIQTVLKSHHHLMPTIRILSPMITRSYNQQIGKSY